MYGNHPERCFSSVPERPRSSIIKYYWTLPGSLKGYKIASLGNSIKKWLTSREKKKELCFIDDFELDSVVANIYIYFLHENDLCKKNEMSAKKKGVNGGCLATGEGSTEKIFRSSFTRCQAIIIHIPHVQMHSTPFHLS